MGLFRLRSIFKLKGHNQAGQSTVEYVLLFAVVTVLVMTIFKSDKFKELFGDNGKFSDVYRRELEFSYRHGLSGRKPFETPNYIGGEHESFKGENGSSRFFGAKDGYPK